MSTIVADVLRTAIEPALAFLPTQLDTPRARLLMIAIALQESRCTARCQVLDGGGRGPARGLWQFERGGGVRGVLTHVLSRGLAKRLCTWREVDIEPLAVWGRLEHDDVLAAGFARLLLWTDPQPLPLATDAQAGWDLYARTWRPGKPHRQTWNAFHAQARQAVGL